MNGKNFFSCPYKEINYPDVNEPTHTSLQISHIRKLAHCCHHHHLSAPFPLLLKYSFCSDCYKRVTSASYILCEVNWSKVGANGTCHILNLFSLLNLQGLFLNKYCVRPCILRFITRYFSQLAPLPTFSVKCYLQRILQLSKFSRSEVLFIEAIFNDT